jgi:hypothetical protein
VLFNLTQPAKLIPPSVLTGYVSSAATMRMAPPVQFRPSPYFPTTMAADRGSCRASSTRRGL